MCFTISQQKNEIVNLIINVDKNDYQNKISFEKIQNNYFISGFQHPKLVILCENEINIFGWGLIPFWTKSEDDALKIRSMTLNARGETVYEKPSFRIPIRTQRCILPVNGFVEWKEVEKKKIPHYIFPKDKEFFYIGCIYDTWTDKQTGEENNTFSMITVPANNMMREIHNSGANKHRMPLIIDENSINKWNDTKLQRNTIELLIKPYEENLMQAHAISKEDMNSRNQRK